MSIQFQERVSDSQLPFGRLIIREHALKVVEWVQSRFVLAKRVFQRAQLQERGSHDGTIGTCKLAIGAPRKVALAEQLLRTRKSQAALGCQGTRWVLIERT